MPMSFINYLVDPMKEKRQKFLRLTTIATFGTDRNLTIKIMLTSDTIVTVTCKKSRMGY